MCIARVIWLSFHNCIDTKLKCSVHYRGKLGIVMNAKEEL
ncbi:hypothetical protein SL1157_2806 [Ruegeria lacuscaerulensis ITI-1157]|nr:hypothetical protein SL1157_2806 [Ruegeria lacuscaerulensis ITI-1157]